jgi:hypothetical protein
MVLRAILHCLPGRGPGGVAPGPSLPQRPSVWGAVLFLMLCLGTLAWAHEDPRGDVFPLVESAGEGFRLSYLANDAWYEAGELSGDGALHAQRERSVLWTRQFTKEGRPEGRPARGPAFVTTYDTDRFYGRPILIFDLMNGFLRTDGLNWFMLCTGTGEPSWELELTRSSMLHPDRVALPWGKAEFVRVKEGYTEAVSLGVQAGGGRRLEPVQFHIDREHLLTVVSPVFGRSRLEDRRAFPNETVLYAFRRSESKKFSGSFRLILRQPLPSPIIYAAVGVPCIRRSNGKYYVAHLASVAMPSDDNVLARYAADVFLLEWSPTTGAVRTARLAKGIEWNTHISFDMIGKRGLLAYHQANPLGYYQLRSKIVTKAFDIGKLEWKAVEQGSLSRPKEQQPAP